MPVPLKEPEWHTEWRDWIYSIFHSFLYEALMSTMFSPLFQMESSLRLLICSLVCQAPSTSNDKYVEKCANYLYRVLILSAIQSVSHEEVWFLWNARNGLSRAFIKHQFIYFIVWLNGSILTSKAVCIITAFVTLYFLTGAIIQMNAWSSMSYSFDLSLRLKQSFNWLFFLNKKLCQD